MEDLAALGVASTKVQFLEHGSILFTKSRKLYREGGIQDIKSSAQVLRWLSSEVRISFVTSSVDEEDQLRLAVDCD
ncbi:uncharacterized protein BCR38DRAFT_445953 [Pseudomassariella vexata]|uniref:Uncharacterized protein n=1 Tax=Pseudomassariella vexata TaxID=1141098 RepID=A0A1Y2DJ18_9PEZI|nr:uncharacterized protein BCR38DRAFT_445953 [Pseudomassariella vexata]ORY59227.1 hypothetical protein BCR38DRAFT_445953 [Pseudomassariella vexata]